jgi:hypothetical protein
VENRPHIAIWTSSDAEQWQEIQTPPLFDRAAEPTVTQGASGLLVFGEQIDGNSTPTNALTWIAPYP